MLYLEQLIQLGVVNGYPGCSQKVGVRVHLAIGKGRLQRSEICWMCGVPESENPFPASGPLITAHHHDYKKPFYIHWLCRRCHRMLHARIRERRELQKLADFWGVGAVVQGSFWVADNLSEQIPSEKNEREK